jgi:hypothetical protein
MTSTEKWDTNNFDEMSWHDVHVHGFRIVQNDPTNGTAELMLDIDYILEWRESNGAFSFVVSQATLQFHEVFGLRLALDYATPTAGMCPFSLAGIKRERFEHQTGYSSYRWRLYINWPSGQIEFESPGFTQCLVGQPYTQPSQWLEPSQRSAA